MPRVMLLEGSLKKSTAKPAGSRYSCQFSCVRAAPQLLHVVRERLAAVPKLPQFRHLQRFRMFCSSAAASSEAGICQFRVMPLDSYTRPLMATLLPGAYSVSAEERERLGSSRRRNRLAISSLRSFFRCCARKRARCMVSKVAT